jgi:hypothetical protein
VQIRNFPSVSNTNMTDARTWDVEATLALLISTKTTKILYGNICLKILQIFIGFEM